MNGWVDYGPSTHWHPFQLAGSELMFDSPSIHPFQIAKRPGPGQKFNGQSTHPFKLRLRPGMVGWTPGWVPGWVPDGPSNFDSGTALWNGWMDGPSNFSSDPAL